MSSALLIELRMRASLKYCGPSGSRYQYVPFDVPFGIAGLRISWCLAKAPSGSHIDIGVFDARGLVSGFRGWRSSAKSSITIASRWATPGFVAGAIPTGRWNICVGMELDAGSLLEAEFLVALLETDFAPLPVDEAPSRARLSTRPAAVRDHFGALWLPGDLHVHTFHSDSPHAPCEVLDSAAERGLSFLALTDHNTVTQNEITDDRLTVIPALELTTYRGHMNIWGVRTWLDYRCENDDDVRAVVRAAHSQGAVVSVNHPKTDGPPWEFGSDVDFDAVEAWQALWFVSNYQSLAWWDGLLQSGRHVALVGGSDLHHLSTPQKRYAYGLGNPTTWVCAESTRMDALLEAIKVGRTFVSARPSGPHLFISASAGGACARPGDVLPVQTGARIRTTVLISGAPGRQLRLISGGRVVASETVSNVEQVFRLDVPCAGDGYLRAEVIEAPEEDLTRYPEALMVEALTGAIYMQEAV